MFFCYSLTIIVLCIIRLKMELFSREPVMTSCMTFGGKYIYQKAQSHYGIMVSAKKIRLRDLLTLQTQR